MKQLDKGIFFRLLVSVLLLVTAFGLYIAGRPPSSAPARIIPTDLVGVAKDLDREVDTVLAHFSIQRQWMRKRQIEIPGTGLFRIERRVLVPLDTQVLQMNLAFNAMAKRYDGRAIGSENTKENTVTIHLARDGYILQTIILKPTRELPKAAPKSKQKKV